ncbi:MAG: AraC family transcriptional regulator [Clostridiaceae bacterium]|nr:AraC family transcriptional regulator [Clostridiaceae bacterium]
MGEITYYRDENLPFFEIKSCTLNLHPEKKHAHDEYSIALIEKGNSVLGYLNEYVEISQGQVVLIEADIMHLCQPKDKENWVYQMLYIKKTWFKDLLKQGVLPHKLLVKSLKRKEVKMVQTAFNQLKSQISTLEKEEILIELIEYLFYIENCFIFNEEVITNNDIACEKIKEFINANFLEKIYLEQLSELCGLSRYYIIRLFKQKHDITPHAYQISCRMNYAKEEMSKGREVTRIAHEIGFYDESHFSKTFKSYFGVTPQAYLK